MHPMNVFIFFPLKMYATIIANLLVILIGHHIFILHIVQIYMWTVDMSLLFLKNKSNISTPSFLWLSRQFGNCLICHSTLCRNILWASVKKKTSTRGFHIWINKRYQYLLTPGVIMHSRILIRTENVWLLVIFSPFSANVASILGIIFAYITNWWRSCPSRVK